MEENNSLTSMLHKKNHKCTTDRIQHRFHRALPSFQTVLLSVILSCAFGYSLPRTPTCSLSTSRNHLRSIESKRLSFIRPNTMNMPNEKVMTLSGGGIDDVAPSSTTAKQTFKLISSMYATTGVIYILAKAVFRVVPIALEPWQGGIALSSIQIGAYIATCLFFAYAEGYKGFQLKFTPLVVSRALTLNASSPIHHLLFAPAYAMGLFHATRKRMTVSWGVTLGVGGIVAAVKRLSYPYRNIIDAGVVVGLTWGAASLFIQYINAVISGLKSSVDPALPKKK